jgi:hypothetical protein
MRKKLVISGLVLAVFIAVIAEASAQTIYACYNKNSGAMRHVNGSGLCKKSEFELSWYAGPVFSTNYFESNDLNTRSFNATSTFQKIDDLMTFNKERDDTIVEVTLNSRAGGGSFGGGASGVGFEIRIDGNAPTWDNRAAITTSDSIEFISIFAVFGGLAAGEHKVSVWAIAWYGTSTDVELDPGNFGGRIIVKETF